MLLEKVQVTLLAERLNQLLAEVRDRGAAVPEDPSPTEVDTAPLDEPINEAFRVGTLSLGWDTGDELVILEARELTEDEEDDDETSVGEDDDDEDGPDMLRVRFAPSEARRFIARAVRVLASIVQTGVSRPPCPLCGQPLDPQGHLCPRRNGHLLN